MAPAEPVGFIPYSCQQVTDEDVAAVTAARWSFDLSNVNCIGREECGKYPKMQGPPSSALHGIPPPFAQFGRPFGGSGCPFDRFG